MPSIHITVRNKIARPAPGESVVSDNDDYRAVFDFDEEWDGVTGKVARFVYGDEAADVPFEGTCCPAPVLPAAKTVKIGVYAGETLATSPAVFPIRRAAVFPLTASRPGPQTKAPTGGWGTPPVGAFVCGPGRDAVRGKTAARHSAAVFSRKAGRPSPPS